MTHLQSVVFLNFEHLEWAMVFEVDPVMQVSASWTCPPLLPMTILGCQAKVSVTTPIELDVDATQTPDGTREAATAMVALFYRKHGFVSSLGKKQTLLDDNYYFFGSIVIIASSYSFIIF